MGRRSYAPIMSHNTMTYHYKSNGECVHGLVDKIPYKGSSKAGLRLPYPCSQYLTDCNFLFEKQKMVQCCTLMGFQPDKHTVCSCCKLEGLTDNLIKPTKDHILADLFLDYVDMCRLACTVASFCCNDWQPTQGTVKIHPRPNLQRLANIGLRTSRILSSEPMDSGSSLQSRTNKKVQDLHSSKAKAC